MVVTGVVNVGAIIFASVPPGWPVPACIQHVTWSDLPDDNNWQ